MQISLALTLVCSFVGSVTFVTVLSMLLLHFAVFFGFHMFVLFLLMQLFCLLHQTIFEHATID